MLIDEQPDHQVMHLHGLGEANRSPCQPFDPRTEGEMRACDSPGPPFPRAVASPFQLPRVSTPLIGVKAFDPKWFKELPQLLQHFIFAPAKHLRQDLARLVIDGVP
jgi:hypothetical protein